MRIAHPMTGLSDKQLATLIEAAAPLWPQRRDAFLRSVFNRLAGVPHPSDKELASAIAFVLACYTSALE
jgi:hypothetical protein